MGGKHPITANRLGRTPDCYREQEWIQFFDACRDEARADRAVDPRIDIDVTWEYAMHRACESCQVAHQFAMRLMGRCHPPVGARTPLGVYGGEGEQLVMWKAAV